MRAARAPRSRRSTPRSQREALKILADGVFSADSFRFKPEFMRRVQVDYLNRNDIFDSGLSAPGVDYSLNTQVLNTQRKVLNVLMSDGVAQRILDSEVKVSDPKSALQLSELYGTLSDAIWSELRDRPRHHCAAPQPAARAPRAARKLIAAAEHDDARRRALAAARAGARAAPRHRSCPEPQRLLEGDQGASRRSAHANRRGTEGADRPAGG